MSELVDCGTRYLDYRGAARYSDLSETTLRRLIESGKLRAYRPTGERKVLIDRTELDELIQASVTGKQEVK
jgi:excisionase family DNA binding protein